MAKSVRFKLSLKGLNELMKSSEMQDALGEAGEAVAKNAEGMSGEKYEYDVRTHDDMRWIAAANVYPETFKARMDNYKNNTLEKALRSSGLPTTKK